MIARFLRRLLGRRDPFGYTAAERDIFQFWDGKSTRLADPLAVQRALVTDPDLDLKHDPALMATPKTPGLLATGRVATATRKAFKVADLDHGGLTDGECVALFCEFGDYIGGLTEAARPLASSPPPTAAASPTAESSPTATSAASGSTAEGQVATPTAP